jgi:flavin-dependent dehydrogenase
MEYHETIIIGGGPAGSSCAWELVRHQKDVLVLDKHPFPRLKLCAGWVPAKVLKALEVTPETYPHSMMKLATRMYFAPFQFPLFGNWALPWRTDYSIRRIEFDHWLLQYSKAPFRVHFVRKIVRQHDRFILDGKYECKYLVGAGGTACPVRRAFFPHQRAKELQISTIEKEFEYPQRQDTAHLFFCSMVCKGMPGMSLKVMFF